MPPSEAFKKLASEGLMVEVSDDNPVRGVNWANTPDVFIGAHGLKRHLLAIIICPDFAFVARIPFFNERKGEEGHRKKYAAELMKRLEDQAMELQEPPSIPVPRGQRPSYNPKETVFFLIGNERFDDGCEDLPDLCKVVRKVFFDDMGAPYVVERRWRTGDSEVAGKDGEGNVILGRPTGVFTGNISIEGRNKDIHKGDTTYTISV